MDIRARPATGWCRVTLAFGPSTVIPTNKSTNNSHVYHSVHSDLYFLACVAGREGTIGGSGVGACSGMLPNSAIGVATPRDPADVGEGQENGPGHRRHPHGTAKQLLTEPRPRPPLRGLDNNRIHAESPSVGPPLPPTATLKAASAPPIVRCGKRAPETGNGRVLADHQISLPAAAPQAEGLKRPTPLLANQKPLVADGRWIYTADRAGVLQIAQRLGMPRVEEGIATPLDLLRHQEEQGSLSPALLVLFSGCPGVHSLLLGPTYGAQINEWGLPEEGRLPWINCTMPLYKGYAELAVLDLTCIPITDENLRYLIRLPGLRALGLSGTQVTAKGLRYLGKHAAFRTTLQCLKLCCMEKLDDEAIPALAAFPALNELDLYGSSRVSLAAVLRWLPCDLERQHSPINRIRLPERAFAQLREQHVTYAAVARQHPDLLGSVGALAGLPAAEVRRQLRIHQKHYPHIFLNLDCACLAQKLGAILVLRQKEETLWAICS